MGLWQYSWTGQVDGINGNVDMNYVNKDYPKIIHSTGKNGLKPIHDRKKGDVNGDGIINSRNYIKAKRIFMGTYIPTDEEFWVADIDDDGTVGSDDIQKIKRTAIGTYTITDYI